MNNSVAGLNSLITEYETHTLSLVQNKVNLYKRGGQEEAQLDKVARNQRV